MPNGTKISLGDFLAVAGPSQLWAVEKAELNGDFVWTTFWSIALDGSAGIYLTTGVLKLTSEGGWKFVHVHRSAAVTAAQAPPKKDV